jgi:hypothetical protein
MHQLGYGEFVTSTSTDPNFYKVPPIPGYAFEIHNEQPSKPNTTMSNTTASRLRNHLAKNHPQKQNIVMINKGGIVRNKELWTDWRIIRKELGLADQKGDDDLQNPYEMNEFFDKQNDENQKIQQNNDTKEQEKDEKETEPINQGDAVPVENDGSDIETNTAMQNLKVEGSGTVI